MKNLYYAHPLNLYGSEQEKRDIEVLGRLFPELHIYNPNNPECNEGYKAFGMDYFRDLLKQDFVALAFRATPGGRITAGVWAEIEEAEKLGLDVIELPTLIDRDMTVEQTRRYLREIGYR